MTTGTAGAVALGAGDRVAAVAQVRALLRMPGDGEDALLGTLVGEAYALAEQFTGQVLVRRTLSEAVTADGSWRRLAATPVWEIAQVATPAGAVLASDGYAIDIDAAGDGWVRVRSAPERRAIVTLSAGIAEDWAGLPPGIAGGIVRLAAHRFGPLGDEGAPPAAVAALWRPWRRMRLYDRMPADAGVPA